MAGQGGARRHIGRGRLAPQGLLRSPGLLCLFLLGVPAGLAVPKGVGVPDASHNPLSSAAVSCAT